MASDAAAASAATSRREMAGQAILLGASGAALAVRLYATRHVPIGYDGYWHVFSARNFVREYTRVAHPPLFLLLVAACDRIAHHPLAYRAVSLAAGTAVVYLLGRVLANLGVAPAVAAIGTLLGAFSPDWIVLSCEVRSYTLCAAFLLAALLFAPDLLRMDRLPSRRSRVAFSALMVLALLSHYAAALALAALAAAPLLLAVPSPSYRRALGRCLPRRWRADLTTFAAPVLAGVILYEELAKPWSRTLNYLAENYYRPGAETVGSFLARNLANTLALLAPLSVAGALGVGLLVLAVAAMWVGALAGPRDGPEWPGRAMPAAVLTLLLLIGMAAGVAGVYPFGGAVRHQFLLLLFALLASGIAGDALWRSLPGRGLRGALLGLALAALAWRFVGLLRSLSVPFPTGPSPEMVTFRAAFPRARFVHVDQYSLIVFFTQYQDWDWRFEGRDRGNPFVERYALARGGQTLTVVAHRDWWTMDFADPRLYRDLVAAAAPDASPCLWIFSLRQWMPGLARRNLPATTEAVRAAAAGAGLRPARLLVEDEGIFAKLCHERPAAVSGRPGPDRIGLAASP